MCNEQCAIRNEHFSLLGEPLFFEPENQIPGPRVDVIEGRLVLQAKAVRALLVNMQVEGHAVSLQRGGEFQAVFNFHHFVFGGVPDEARRRVAADLFLIREQLHQLGRGFLAEQIVL